jgi:UDP-N-acetylglucosamine--N-acetylmuramyl-(pentapeptide) pyrophosphoryl-undecaprenol N-acetylglucosamine transferase
VEQVRFLISGGGTGGHIFPAISIANELSDRIKNSKIEFVGAKNRMEMEKIPENGYSVSGLWISGIKRSFNYSNLLVPFQIIFSLIKSYLIIKQFKPHYVIGTGGFASGPLLYIASKLRVPTLIQEQNSYPGLTNKISIKICKSNMCFLSRNGKIFSKS